MVQRGAEKVVVFVDDDEAVLAVLTAYFRSLGYRTRGYDGGAALLEGLQWSPEIDCIVTDVKMPGMDGLEVLAALRARGVLSPVVLMTGHGDITLAVQAMKAGAFDFLEKPLNPEKLGEIVKSAIADHGAMKTAEADVRSALSRLERLTDRQKEVLELVANGLTSKEIALQLQMSFRTVEAHRTAIMDKLEVRTMAELIKLKVTSQLGVDAVGSRAP